VLTLAMFYDTIQCSNNAAWVPKVPELRESLLQLKLTFRVFREGNQLTKRIFVILFESHHVKSHI
jgi:hypothetical protein